MINEITQDNDVSGMYLGGLEILIAYSYLPYKIP